MAIPAFVGPDGKFTKEAFTFTTKAYEQEALRLVIEEANQAATELQLNEMLPITAQDITRKFIVGYGHSQISGIIGMVATRSYSYSVSVADKLSYVSISNYDQHCLAWRHQYQQPQENINTVAAYNLATQWLSAVSVDVNGLNRDCKLQCKTNDYWNGGIGSNKYVPIYDVYWIPPKNKAQDYGSSAAVELFLPTKTLISLRVEDPKYNRRDPIVFTNLDALLSSASGHSAPNSIGLGRTNEIKSR